jgi:DHA1 family bicyclomycin/chloramphenicol resistance-like MFS transporter
MLGALYTITPFSIDMYLPAFPKIAADLNTSVSKVALSISTYFLGYAFGQIFYGPLLDRFGRKQPLYLGLILYIVSSIGCISFNSIESFLLFRFLQAFGGCVAAVAVLAMVRDFFPVNEGARIISFLILILGVSPLLAPTAGSFIIASGNWRLIFILLALIVIAILIVIIFFLPEGHSPDKTVSLKLKPIFKNFKLILSAPLFYVYALAGSFSFGGLFVYLAGSPGMFMEEFHVTAKVYGGIFALLAVGFIGGSQLNHLLTRKYSSEKIFKSALIIQVIAAIFFFIGMLNSWYGLAATIGLLFALLLCAGVSFPNAAALAIAPFSKNAGSASALLGFLQIGIGGVLSSGVGFLNLKSSLATALIMAASSVIGLIILMIGKTQLAKRASDQNGILSTG